MPAVLSAMSKQPNKPRTPTFYMTSKKKKKICASVYPRTPSLAPHKPAHVQKRKNQRNYPIPLPNRLPSDNQTSLELRATKRENRKRKKYQGKLKPMLVTPRKPIAGMTILLRIHWPSIQRSMLPFILLFFFFRQTSNVTLLATITGSLHNRPNAGHLRPY